MTTATIVIKDEVNVKIENLDLVHRKRLVDKFKFEVPGAKYTPAVKLGRWDGKKTFFQIGGQTYLNLLDQIIPLIDSYGYDIEVSDQRTYATPEFVFEEFTEHSFAHCTWPEGHPKAGEPVIYRDYQVEIVNAFLNNLQGIYEAATGAGKTIITAALSKLVEKYGNSIIIVPNKSLVVQTEADYINLGLDVGVYFGDRKELGHKHTISTWQSLNVLLKDSIAGTAEFSIYDLAQNTVCIMCDEAHGATASVLTQLLTQVFAHVPIRWGLTGTMPKDQANLTSLTVGIGNVIGRLKARELQDEGHLAHCHVNIIQLVDHVTYKDYQQELSYLVKTPERLEFIAKIISKIKDSGNTLVLVDRIETGRILQTYLSSEASLLAEEGSELAKEMVPFISGKIGLKDRKEEYKELNSGDNRVTIATYGVAAVGINVPRIFNLVCIEPGKSYTRVIQSIGRSIRMAEDKDFSNIYDIASTCKFSSRHLSTRKQYYTEVEYPYTVEKVKWQK